MKDVVMAIGAHPDDIEFGCGGTLLNHKEFGYKVSYCCMNVTQLGDKTNNKVIRSHEQVKQETENAATILGVDELHYLPFTDLNVPFSLESVSELEKLIKQYKVNTIYTHWSGDSNQDHIATFKTTMAAARYVPNVYCYEQIPIPRHTDNPMRINTYTDRSDSFDDNIKSA